MRLRHLVAPAVAVTLALITATPSHAASGRLWVYDYLGRGPGLDLTDPPAACYEIQGGSSVISNQTDSMVLLYRSGDCKEPVIKNVPPKTLLTGTGDARSVKVLS